MGPLEHLTVVDLSGSVATAWCAKLFADFDARVVNLEGAHGHPTRADAALHALLSPHKHSVGLDWRDAAEILARADLVLEAETPGMVSASGLTFSPAPQSRVRACTAPAKNSGLKYESVRSTKSRFDGYIRR